MVEAWLDLMVYSCMAKPLSAVRRGEAAAGLHDGTQRTTTVHGRTASGASFDYRFSGCGTYRLHQDDLVLQNFIKPYEVLTGETAMVGRAALDDFAPFQQSLQPEHHASRDVVCIPIFHYQRRAKPVG